MPAGRCRARRASGRPDVLALAFHVTYWDRLGWKDTLGDERYTRASGPTPASSAASQLYTPQAVVAGQLDCWARAAASWLEAVGTVVEHGQAQLIEIGADGSSSCPR